MQRPAVIRRATLEDRTAVFGIHVDSVTDLCQSHYTSRQIGGWFVGRSADDYAGAIGCGALWLAEIDGEPAGFVEAFPGLISMMFVRPASAGRGLGNRLLSLAVTEAQGDPPVVIRLDATLNAQAFYEKHGFRKVGDSRLIRASGLELPTVAMAREPGLQGRAAASGA